MGAGAVSGHKNSQNNSSNSTSSNRTAGESREAEAGGASQMKPKSPTKSSPPTNMSCELCSVNFTFFKRKKYCVECQRYFCSTCLPKPPSSAPSGRKCSKCRLLLSGCFTRIDLQNYKVKDIRCFLKVKNISMVGCKEKHDLVELVLTHFCTQNGSNTEETEHEMLVRQMAAHMRNVSFVHERGGQENGSTNTSVPDQRPDGRGNQQAAPPSSSATSTPSPTSATATTTTTTKNAIHVSSSASATATSEAPVTSSSSSSSTAAAACASTSPASTTSAAAAAENNVSSSAAEGNGNSNATSGPGVGREESSTEPDGWEGLEEDLEERINNLNTDRLRELLEAMERLQETFTATQEDDDATPAAPTVRRTQLDDVKAVEDVENLTVRQLKELLVNNFVDYRGCCERSELVEKVKNLWKDHQENVALAQAIQEEEEAEAVSLSTKKAGTSSINDPPCNSGVEAEKTDAKSSTSGAESSTNPQHSSSSDSLDPSAQGNTGKESPSTAKAADEPVSPGKLDAEASSADSSSPSRRTRNQQDSLCNICMDNLADCILLECGHMVTCTQCGKRLANCPICRQYISRVVRVFRT